MRKRKKREGRKRRRRGGVGRKNGSMTVCG
jgi:hypothetical protein